LNAVRNLAEVKPFRGIFYSPKKVEKLTEVTAPPYDVISAEAQHRHYERHPYNIIRLILGKEFSSDTPKNSRYTRAKNCLDDWEKEGVFVRDSSPSFYLYQQKYSFQGKERTINGLVSLVRLEELGSGVLPHEKTMPKPKRDRLSLIRACQANLDQIFALYSDPDDQIKPIFEKSLSSPPLVEAQDEEGVEHRVYRISAEGSDKIGEILRGKSVFLADGHHRYETALAYREEKRRKFPDLDEQPYDYVMMMLVNLESEDLTVLPNHRLLKSLPLPAGELRKKLEEFFEIKKVADGVARKNLADLLAKRDQDGHAFALYIKDEGFFLLTLKDEKTVEEAIDKSHSAEWKHLDVSILHALILEYVIGFTEKELEGNKLITLTQDANKAIKFVDEGNYAAALFLNPTKINDIRTIASKGERMPQKSTYFYPKLLSGLILNKHEW
jgi:uncharacterized protein (DUF1015 family)